MAATLRHSHAGMLAECNCELGGAALMLWSFLADFAPALGLHAAATPQDLLAAMIEGASSRRLVNTHIALLRFIQAEAETAFASTPAQARGPPRVPHPLFSSRTPPGRACNVIPADSQCAGFSSISVADFHGPTARVR